MRSSTRNRKAGHRKRLPWIIAVVGHNFFDLGNAMVLRVLFTLNLKYPMELHCRWSESSKCPASEQGRSSSEKRSFLHDVINAAVHTCRGH